MQAKIEHPYVEVNPEICHGSPVVAGTRIRVVDIAMEYEYMNCTPDEIINAHPHLKWNKYTMVYHTTTKIKRNWTTK